MSKGPAASLTPGQVRAELADWAGHHWDPAMSLRDWRELLLESGWAVPSWPERWYGLGLPAWADDLVATELLRLGAIFEKVSNWQPFAITDGRLITGQNPASSTAGAKALLKVMAAEPVAA